MPPSASVRCQVWQKGRGTVKNILPIDVHAHVVPPVFREALENAGGDPSGWHIPDWTPEEALAVQDRLGVKAGCLFLDKASNRQLARACNEYCRDLRQQYPDRFGFYVNLPNVYEDLEGSLEEIKFAFEVLGAEGVCLFPQYSGFYLGHPHYIRLWEEMTRLQTTVIIHPTPPKDYKPMPGQKYCPCPAFDFPHETTRVVSDLVMSGRKADHPNVAVVLCHGGGTVPFLAERIARTTTAPALKNPLSPPEIIGLFKTFHYDTALCGSDPQFSLTAAFVPEDKLVYGTDHPYTPRDAMLFFSDELGKRDWKGDNRKMMDSSNAGKLFPRFM